MVLWPLSSLRIATRLNPRFSTSPPAIVAITYPSTGIVQDWFWWKTEGDPIFNENIHRLYPAELTQLHDEHIHGHDLGLGPFRCQIRDFQTIKATLGYPRTRTVYDATNPKGPRFWKSRGFASKRPQTEIMAWICSSCIESTRQGTSVESH